GAARRADRGAVRGARGADGGSRGDRRPRTVCRSRKGIPGASTCAATRCRVPYVEGRSGGGQGAVGGGRGGSGAAEGGGGGAGPAGGARGGDPAGDGRARSERRQERPGRDPGRNRGRRGGAVRRRPFQGADALRRGARLRRRDAFAVERRGGGIQGGDLRDQGRGRLLGLQVRG